MITCAATGVRVQRTIHATNFFAETIKSTPDRMHAEIESVFKWSRDHLFSWLKARAVTRRLFPSRTISAPQMCLPLEHMFAARHSLQLATFGSFRTEQTNKETHQFYTPTKPIEAFLFSVGAFFGRCIFIWVRNENCRQNGNSRQVLSTIDDDRMCIWAARRNIRSHMNRVPQDNCYFFHSHIQLFLL